MSKVLLLVDASQPIHSPAGLLVGKMYYRGFLDKVLAPNEFSGYPHNGPEHTLRLKLCNKDISAFLALVKETFNCQAAEDFAQSVMRYIAETPAERLLIATNRTA